MTKYILRLCNDHLRSSRYGFQYPKNGKVECNDWRNDNACGNGLHGWDLTAKCDFTVSSESSGYYQVIKVDTRRCYVELSGKVKFKRGVVVLTTRDFVEAYNLIHSKSNQTPKYSIEEIGAALSIPWYLDLGHRGYVINSNKGYCGSSYFYCVKGGVIDFVNYRPHNHVYSFSHQKWIPQYPA